MKQEQRSHPESRELWSLAPRRQERIVELTMQKIEQERSRRPRTPRRVLTLIAAVLTLAALSLTAFAAYENSWFGFDRIFGKNAALVESEVVRYSLYATEASPTLASLKGEPETPVESEAEVPAAIETVQTQDLRFCLDSVLAGQDTLLAIVRAEALTDAGRQALAVSGSEQWPGEQGGFSLIAEVFAQGHSGEAANGSMSMRLLSREGDTACYLLTNTGGSFHLGDRVRIHQLDGGRGKDLFWVNVERLIRVEAELPLDKSVYPEEGYQFDRLSLTPVGLKLWGRYESPTNNAVTPNIRIELKDGTGFSLFGPENGYQYAPYGSPGALSYSMAGGPPEDPILEYSWSFSQWIDLEELAGIWVDGVLYTLD